LLTINHLVDLVKKARTSVKRKFPQSFELVLTLQDIDFKKQDMNVNEVVFLPYSFTKEPSVCVFASGDMALRAQKAGADTIQADGLDRLASEKKEAKKMSRRYNFFLAEPTLMARIGKVLGPQLGPKGKMPTPVPPNASIENMITRFKTATRLRCKNQISISCKVGDEGMKDEQVAENALVVFNTLEKKLPSGAKNIKNAMFKLTMSPPSKLLLVKVK
jgi:large subunit ribosomal protein L1